MKSITFNDYFGRIVIVAVLYVALPMAFSVMGDLTTGGSYVRAVLCFFVLLMLSALILMGKRYVRFYAIAYLLLVALGLVHYLVFVDPDYFSSDGSPVEAFWGEYQAVFSNVSTLVDGGRDYGLLYFDSTAWNVTHPEIWRIISIPFQFLQHKWMNYSPLNVYSSLLAAMNVMLIYNRFNPGLAGNYKGARKILQYTTAYFPQFLLNGILWRDPFGVAIISIGLAMLMLSNTVVSRVISFVATAFLSFMQRTAYVMVAGATMVFKEVAGTKKNGNKYVLIILFMIVFVFTMQFFNENEKEDYVSGYVNDQSFLYLPFKILVGVAGPFPWLQFSQYFMGNVHVAYQLQDYLLGTFQLGYVMAIISNRKRFTFKNLDYMTIFGFGVMLSGFMSSMMHIGYIAEGLFFTLPWFFKRMGSDYWKYFGWSFLILIGLNMVALMLPGGFGVTGIWR